MKKVIVIGAGIIGICCALEIRKKGYAVSLLDKNAPASQASFGNAGVINNSGIAPYAHPDILSSLIRFSLNKDPRFLLHWPHIFSLLPWLFKFLSNCNENTYQHCTSSLSYLLEDAVALHRSYLREANAEDLLRDTGWLSLIKDQESFNLTSTSREDFDHHGVAYQILNSGEIHELEPHLKRKYAKAIWLTDTSSVSNPATACLSYLNLFKDIGGEFLSLDVKKLIPRNDKWQISCDGESLECDHVVIAMGMHSNDLIKPLRIRIPLAMERGYHLAYQLQAGKHLGRPIIEADQGIVMSPMDFGIRVTSAVNLVAREATANPKQIINLIPEIESILPMEKKITDQPWMGSRPSIPDSMPIIGPAAGTESQHRNLWLAFGHGHLGLTLGPKTGMLIANSLSGGINDKRADAFLPSRFL